MTRPDPFAAFRGQAAKHLASRGRVLLGGALAALLGAAYSVLLPERTEAAVAERLAACHGGVVEPTDFVWEPSRGWFDDLFRGRRVLFLARAAADEPRDVFRATVHVTPFGHSLRARALVRITDTADADERALLASGTFAAFAAHWNGAYRSISLLSLRDDPELTSANLRSPAARLALEIGGGELVAAWDTGATALDLGAASTVGGEPLAWVARPVPAPERRVFEPAVVERGASQDAGFSTAGYEPAVVLAPGREPAVALRRHGESEALLLDGRQLAFSLVVGRSEPTSNTGFVASGRSELSGTRHVAVITLPAAGGALEGEAFVSPFAPAAPTLMATRRGALRVGSWSWPVGEAPAEFPRAVALGSSTSQAGGHALCVTAGGHLALISSGSARPDALLSLLPSGCVLSVHGHGAIAAMRVGDQLDLPEPSEQSLLIASESTVDGLALPLTPAGFAPATVGQPTPTFLPALHERAISMLGAEVSVLRLDPTRYDFGLLAGQEERSHRKGGQFPERLTEGEAGRARLAFGLGVGKRKKPRGLRIAGSFGHEPSRREAAIVAGPGAVRVIHGAEIDKLPPQLDVTEVPLTAAAGELVAKARERGPLQQRADLCVTPAGELLIAQAEFDSHEATASSLLRLGCQVVVALDRGAERPAWKAAGDKAQGPFATTALVAFDRPLQGSVGGE